MLDNLPPLFVDELNKDSSQPRLLVEFHFPSGVRYLSDQPLGIDDGLLNNYEPLIESWGQLRDNVRLEPIIAGQSLETRQLSINIINSTNPRFSAAFLNQNPENVKVYIYQWFANIPEADKVLIDILICQDPITTSEASALVTISLVSPIMAKNNYIWGPNKTLEVRYPLVIGKKQVQAQKPIDTPVSFLIYDITFDFTGSLFVEGSTKFPAGPGTIVVDSEQMSYSSFDVNEFIITARGVNGTTARPHIRGALLCNPADNFDYPLCAGPVSVIDNLIGDGVPYENSYTVYPGENPAFIRFPGRPPWHKSEAGAPGPPITQPEETSTQYGASYETRSLYGAAAAQSPGNVNNTSGDAVLNCDNTLGGNITVPYFGTGSYCDDDDWPNANIIGCANINNGTTGTATIEWFATNNASASIPSVGVVFEVQSLFQRDLSSLGNFISVSCRIKGYNRIRGLVGLFELVAVVGGTETVLASITHGSTDATAYQTEKTFDGTYNISVSSWSALQGAKIIIRSKVTATSAWTSSTGRRWELYVWGYWVYWDVVYQDSSSNPTYPESELLSYFNRDLSSLGGFRSAHAIINFDGSATLTETDQSIIFRTSSDPLQNSTLWSRAIDSTSFGKASQTVYPSISSWGGLSSARVGIKHKVASPATPGSRRRYNTNISYVQWVIRYQPGDIDTPDEERVIYVTDLFADVTGQRGALVTPPRAIQGLLEGVGGLNEYVDDVSFDESDALYAAGGFYFNGIVDGALKFHDALRDLLRQGMLRIAYNAGKITVISVFYSTDEAPIQMLIIDKLFEKKDIRQRSFKEQRMRISDVINKVIVQYNPDSLVQEWQGEIEKSDQESIDSVGEQLTSLQFSLITDDVVANKMAERILERVSVPRTFTMFSAYMSAFILEKQDIIYAETDFNDYLGIVGPVMTMNRVFGSGKNNTVNYYEITMTGFPVIQRPINVSESVMVTENVSVISKPAIQLHIETTININELVTNEVIYTHQLNLADTVNIVDLVEVLQGSEVYLHLTDRVDISDFVDTDVSEVISINISSIVSIDELAIVRFEHNRFINIHEQIIINDAIFNLLPDGYGERGYGFAPYGGGYEQPVLVTFGINQVIFKGDTVTFQ